MPVAMAVPESRSATPVPNAPKLQILLPALPRPKTLPRRPPLLPLPLSLFHRRRPLILPSPFNKSLHPHGADGVEEVIHPDPRWPGASACLGRTRAEAALGTAAVADADAAEEGGRVVRRVGRGGGVEAVVGGEGAVVGDAAKGAGGLAGSRAAALPPVVGEARDVRRFGRVVVLFLRRGIGGGFRVCALRPSVADAAG